MRDKGAKMSGNSSGAMDQRAERTRGRLSRALVTLTLADGLDSIRVSDLARAAGIGRSTFYAHFESKNGFVCRAFADMIALCERHERTNGSTDVLPVGTLIRHIEASQGFALATARSRTLAPMLETGERRLRAIAEGNLADRYPAAPPEFRRQTATFLAGALIGQLRHWMQGDLTGSASNLIAAHRRLSDGVLSCLAAPHQPETRRSAFEGSLVRPPIEVPERRSATAPDA